MIRYEHRTQRPLPLGKFIRRLLLHGSYTVGLVGVSMLIGTLGYHLLAGQAWIDSFLNAAMLLGGMGPVGNIDSDAGKLFAAFFALYSGLVFLVAAGLLLAPVFHRVLHYFHWEQGKEG